VPSAAQYGMRGLSFEDERYNQLPLGPSYGKIVKLPSRESLKPFIPRVVAQASTNLAVSWAVAWYAFAGLHAKQLGLTGEAVLKLPLAPAFVYRKVQSAPGCSKSVSMIDVLEELTVNGAPRFSEFRELCADDVALASVEMSLNQRLGGYVRLFNSYDPQIIKVAAVKEAVVLGSPVVVGMICPPSFSLATAFWQPREPAPLVEHGGHAVTVVGYDDDLYGGAFEVVNNWGKSWGKDGFTWIRYEDFARHILYGFRLVGNAGLKATIDFYSDKQQFMALTGGNGSYAFDKSYRTGDRFLIRISSETPVFTKVIAMDPGGQSAVLYPFERGHIALIDRQLDLPAAGHYPLTEPSGKNSIIIILATSRAAYDHTVESVDKEPRDRWPPSDGNWQKERISFTSDLDVIVVNVILDQRD
jgi:hypothetical protein